MLNPLSPLTRFKVEQQKIIAKTHLSLCIFVGARQWSF